MRTVKSLALALIVTCAATNSLAQSRVAHRPARADQWMPASARPYSSQEIYFAPSFYQKIPQIRLTKIEAAYTKGRKDRNGRIMPEAPPVTLSAQAICAAYIETLKTRHQGAAVSHSDCKAGRGLAATPSPNSAHATMAVHYHKGQTITENLSIAITVCEPDEKYDPQQHICIPEEEGSGKEGGGK